MKAQETYSNLFKNYREVLRLNAARALDGARDAAFARFEAMGIPAANNEEYRYCDLRPALEVDYGLNLYRMGIPAHPGEVFRCDVPTLSTKLFFVVNDLFYPNKKPVELPEGIIYGSLNEQLKANPELLERYYNVLCSQGKDAMAALNTTMVQDGFVLYIPAGVQVEQPLQLVQMFQGDIDIMATRRLLIVLEEGASANVIVCDHAMSTAKYFSNQVCEIFLGKDARLEYYEMEMTHDKVTRVSNTYVSQEAGSDLLMNNIGLENGLTRNNVELTFTDLFETEKDVVPHLLPRALQQIVRRAEHVVFGVLGVKMHQREHVEIVADALTGIDQSPVMRPGRLEAHRPDRINDIRRTGTYLRSEARRMQFRTDLADILVKIDRHRRRGNKQT